MADFDPQQPADKKPQGFNQNTDDSGSAGGATTSGGAESSQDWSDFGRTVPATTSRQWEFSHSCCDSGSTADCQEPDDCGAKSSNDESPTQSFFSDWSAAEARSEATSSAAGAEAAAFVPRPTPSSQPETFWAELVRSQVSGAAGRESTDLARVSPETVVGAQSERFWSDLVASQRPESADAATWSSASSKPAGMGWSDEEAAEWSPPERETEFVDRDAEVLETAGEAVGADATARRDGMEWSVPATSSEEWAEARSEGLGETKSLMAAAVEAAQPEAQAKVKKARAPRSAAEKKPAAKKTAARKPAAAKAKKPAVKKAAAAKKPAAKKPAAKKVVKKLAPPPKITKAPTRRAA